MSNTLKSCEVCGSPARVRVLQRYDGAKPDVRSYCLGCADDFESRGPGGAGDRAASLISASGMVAGVGLTFALVSQFGGAWELDHIANSAPWSSAVLWAGCLLIFLGAWFRFDKAAFTLSAFAALAVLVDAVGTTGVNDARGWRQDLGLAFGLAFSVGALALYRRMQARNGFTTAPRRSPGLEVGMTRDGSVARNAAVLSRAGG